MNTDIKQAMHVGAGKSFGTAEANENERRWNDDKIDRKNQDPTNHYDRTRMKLNFEIIIFISNFLFLFHLSFSYLHSFNKNS